MEFRNDGNTVWVENLIYSITQKSALNCCNCWYLIVGLTLNVAVDSNVPLAESFEKNFKN